MHLLGSNILFDMLQKWPFYSAWYAIVNMFLLKQLTMFDALGVDYYGATEICSTSL